MHFTPLFVKYKILLDAMMLENVFVFKHFYIFLIFLYKTLKILVDFNNNF